MKASFPLCIYHFPYGEGSGNPLQHACLRNPMDKRVRHKLTTQQPFLIISGEILLVV